MNKNRLNPNPNPRTTQSQDTYCSPGCRYSDMRSNFCPAPCSIYCYQFCNKTLFCAPGCSYYDLDAGVCSSVCPSRCMDRCDIGKFCTDSCSSTKCDKQCPTLCCRQSGLNKENGTLSWVIPIAVMSAV